MTDWKVIEKGVLRAYWKMFAVIMAVYALNLGAWFGVPKAKYYWEYHRRNKTE